ncbi:Integral membrane protein CcmA involved in cell shape determination [uncultured Sporomusa sp.]|uniref:Integral membrane protein CcmA involved in cell shape determination n=1 Tax=uncultured Sporomusa sp. TaxID=307249 RepID=A0A212LXP6_9FIRM|nr:polymer-forming cytoskeletal protein [uncultured Sporomusa sp.]SCM82276.1 Integral membrane protein CcmA involved in cell shape determination [uncultured Sporomusa sp.]
MFGMKKQAGSGNIGEQVGTIIGSDTSFKGSITSQGTIRIDGQHEGDLTIAGDLVIGERGQLQSQIKARSILVAGMISGNIEATDKLELMPTAKVYGDIKVGTLTINEGAVFRGACQMLKEVPSTENE